MKDRRNRYVMGGGATLMAILLIWFLFGEKGFSRKALARLLTWTAAIVVLLAVMNWSTVDYLIASSF